MNLYLIAKEFIWINNGKRIYASKLDSAAKYFGQRTTCRCPFLVQKTHAILSIMDLDIIDIMDLELDSYAADLKWFDFLQLNSKNLNKGIQNADYSRECLRIEAGPMLMHIIENMALKRKCLLHQGKQLI